MLGVAGGTCQDTHISSLGCSLSNFSLNFLPSIDTFKTQSIAPAVEALQTVSSVSSKIFAVKEADSIFLYSYPSVMNKTLGTELGLNACDPVS